MQTRETGTKTAPPLWKRLVSASNMVAVVFVLAAGAIAWFGTQSGTQVPPTSESITLAAGASPADVEDVTPAQRRAGSLPTRLVAQAAGIDTSISEVGVVREAGRATWETAWRAAGHHINSARPGQPGNMIISGHVSVADANNVAVFANLDQLKVGDVIEVYSGNEVFQYAIQSKSTVLPTALQVLKSNSQSRVTLITCTLDLKQRLVVVGTLI